MRICPTSKTIFKILAAMILCFAVLLPMQEASAKGKRVSNSTAANLLTSCMLSDDARTQRNKSRTKVRCCSRSEGFCITCNMDGSGLCKKSRYRTVLPPWLKDQASNPSKNAPERATPKPRKSKSLGGSNIVAPTNRSK